MTLTINTILFWIGGGLIISAALVLVLFNKSVSTGHNLMLAIGAAIVLVPYVSNFEWSESVVKFTTRTETASLTREVAATQDDSVELRAQVSEIAKGLKALTERLESIEKSIPQSGNMQGQGPKPTWSPLTLDNFILQNEAAKAEAYQRIESLKDFEKTLMKPALQ